MDADQEKLNVIVVDDERDIGMITMLNFRKAIQDGLINFHYFDNGKECLQYLASLPLRSSSVVLADINMPGITGLDLLSKIHQEFPNVEVFMMSAFDDSAVIQKSLGLGAKGYFTKPVNYKSIKHRIEADFGVTPSVL